MKEYTIKSSIDKAEIKLLLFKPKSLWGASNQPAYIYAHFGGAVAYTATMSSP